MVESSTKRTAEHRTRDRLKRILEVGFDKIECMKCGEKDIRYLEIHHIKGRKIENADDISNLSLLCSNCHGLITHGYATIINGEFIEENAPKTELLLQSIKSDVGNRLTKIREKEIRIIQKEIDLNHEINGTKSKRKTAYTYTAKDFL